MGLIRYAIAIVFTCGAAAAAHAATLDVTAGRLTYTATAGVANALTVSLAGSSYAFTDSGETITLSANAITAGWSGSGTNSVSGPQSSVTTGVSVDLRDGTDALNVDTLISVSGVVTLRSGGSFTQTAFIGGTLVTIAADTISIGATLAGATVVTLQPATPSRPIDVGGSTPGTLAITQPEIAFVVTPSLVIGGSDATFTGGIRVTAPVDSTPAGLTLRGAGPFSGTPSASITANSVAFIDRSATGHTWSVAPPSVQEDANPPIGNISTPSLTVNGGSGSDTFNATPSASTTITIAGDLPAPPAIPGDTLNLNTAGTTITGESVTLQSDGFLGVYTFSNRKPIGFAQIESGVTAAPAGADVPTVSVWMLALLGAAIVVVALRQLQ